MYLASEGLCFALLKAKVEPVKVRIWVSSDDEPLICSSVTTGDKSTHNTGLGPRIAVT